MLFAVIAFAAIMITGCFLPWIEIEIHSKLALRESGLETPFGLVVTLVALFAIMTAVVGLITKKDRFRWLYVCIGGVGLLSGLLHVLSVQALQQELLSGIPSKDYHYFLDEFGGLSLADMIGSGVTVSLVGSLCLFVLGIVIIVSRQPYLLITSISRRVTLDHFSRRQVIGLTGVGILLVGCFLPLARLPLIGEINYFQNGSGDGIIMIILALLSCVFLLGKRYLAVLLTGISSACLVSYSTYHFLITLYDIKQRMSASLFDNPFRELGAIAMESTQLLWGLPIILIGVAFITVSGAMRKSLPIVGEDAPSVGHDVADDSQST